MRYDTRLLRLYPSSQPDLLVCIPHAGAGVSAFLDWPRSLRHLLRIALVQLPGREDRMQENFSQTLPEIAAQIADALLEIPARARFIFGHSMGASIAWAVADQLWRRCGIKAIVILSAQSPCFSLGASTRTPASLRDWFRLLGENFPPSLENSELLALFQTLFSADCAWMAREFRTPLAERLPVDLHCLYAVRDGLVSKDNVAQWRNHTSAAFTITPMQGGHLYFLGHPDEVLAFLSNLIEGYSRHDDSTCPA